jgi:hypothetical protein
MDQQPTRPLMMERPGLTMGTILASALTAAVVVYLVRRRRPEPPAQVVTTRAIERARDLVPEDSLRALSEYVLERVLPEFRPALLAIVKDLREQVNEFFDRTEKRIKQL